MIKSNVIDIESATVEIRSDGIVHLTFKEGVLIDRRLQSKVKSIYESAGFTGISKLLISAEDFIITEKLFWEHCKKSERFTKGQIIAVVAQTLAKKILAKNYLYRYKPQNPFLIFDDEQSAVSWLKNPEGEMLNKFQ